jgi:hypothetical protein
MIKKAIPFFMIMFVFSYVFSQKAVYPLPVDSKISITNPTFFYTLPKTAFKADVVITKTSHIKGLYADYADKLLGITNYCNENSVAFNLKSLTLTPFLIPDETQQFVVELSSAQMKNNFLTSLYEKNTTSDFHSFSTLEQNNADFLPDFFENYADVMIQQTYETYTETKIIDGVVTQVPVTQTKTTTKTIAQQAQEAVDFIEKIRKDRYDILSFSQETPLTKEAFEYLVNQLNALEKQYLELFTGITVLEDIHETFDVYPHQDSELQHICSITPTGGFSTSICKTASYNYLLKFKLQNSTLLRTGFYDAPASKNRKDFGYRLRKAEPVFITLVHGDNEETNLGIFHVYQFGLLETLPANLDSFDIGKWGYLN